MKITALLMILFLFTVSSHASEILSTQIHDIMEATVPGEDTRVLVYSDGRVLKASPAVWNTIQHFVKMDGKSYIDFEVTGNHIVSAQASSTHFFSKSISPSTPDGNYIPTRLPNIQAVTQLHNKLDLNLHRRSQCYQRAMLWSHDLWLSNQVKSQKTFLFFTKKYIREFDYKWWFHVAPFLLVASGTVDQEYVIDAWFFKKPLPMREWTNEFMENGAECPTVVKFADYDQHQEEAYCYLRKTTMYQYSPADVESVDEYAKYYSDFTSSDLSHAERARGWSPFSF